MLERVEAITKTLEEEAAVKKQVIADKLSKASERQKSHLESVVKIAAQSAHPKVIPSSS